MILFLVLAWLDYGDKQAAIREKLTTYYMQNLY